MGLQHFSYVYRKPEKKHCLAVFGVTVTGVWCDLLFDSQQADMWFNYNAATMSSLSPSPSLNHGVPCIAHLVSINSKLVIVESVATKKKNKKAVTKKTFKNKQFVH